MTRYTISEAMDITEQTYERLRALDYIAVAMRSAGEDRDGTLRRIAEHLRDAGYKLDVEPLRAPRRIEFGEAVGRG